MSDNEQVLSVVHQKAVRAVLLHLEAGGFDNDPEGVTPQQAAKDTLMALGLTPQDFIQLASDYRSGVKARTRFQLDAAGNIIPGTGTQAEPVNHLKEFQ